MSTGWLSNKTKRTKNNPFISHSFQFDSIDFHFLQLYFKYHKHGQFSSNLAAWASTIFMICVIFWCLPVSVKHNAMIWWHPTPLVTVVHFACFMNRSYPFCPSGALPEWSQDNESLAQPPTENFSNEGWTFSSTFIIALSLSCYFWESPWSPFQMSSNTRLLFVCSKTTSQLVYINLAPTCPRRNTFTTPFFLTWSHWISLNHMQLELQYCVCFSIYSVCSFIVSYPLMLSCWWSPPSPCEHCAQGCFWQFLAFSMLFGSYRFCLGAATWNCFKSISTIQNSFPLARACQNHQTAPTPKVSDLLVSPQYIPSLF